MGSGGVGDVVVDDVVSGVGVVDRRIATTVVVVGVLSREVRQ